MIWVVPYCPRKEEEEEVGHEGEENVEVLLLQELLLKEAEVEVEEEEGHLRKHSKQPVIHHQRVPVTQEIVEKAVAPKKVIIAKYQVLEILLHLH